MKAYKRPKTKIIVEALNKSGGLILPTSKALGVTDYTLRRWIKKSKELQEAVTEAREHTLDIAESSLLENVKAGKEASIFFVLKTLGKKRGYIENPISQVNVNTGKIINYLPVREKYTEEDDKN